MTPDFLAALASPAHWAAIGITLLAVSLTVGLHYEALQRLNIWLARRIAPLM